MDASHNTSHGTTPRPSHLNPAANPTTTTHSSNYYTAPHNVYSPPHQHPYPNSYAPPGPAGAQYGGYIPPHGMPQQPYPPYGAYGHAQPPGGYYGAPPATLPGNAPPPAWATQGNYQTPSQQHAYAPSQQHPGHPGTQQHPPHAGYGTPSSHHNSPHSTVGTPHGGDNEYSTTPNHSPYSNNVNQGSRPDRHTGQLVDNCSR